MAVLVYQLKTVSEDDLRDIDSYFDMFKRGNGIK